MICATAASTSEALSRLAASSAAKAVSKPGSLVLRVVIRSFGIDRRCGCGVWGHGRERGRNELHYPGKERFSRLQRRRNLGSTDRLLIQAGIAGKRVPDCYACKRKFDWNNFRPVPVHRPRKFTNIVYSTEIRAGGDQQRFQNLFYNLLDVKRGRTQ